MLHRPHTRYSPIAQTIHWLTAMLVLVAFIYGPGGSEQRVYMPARDFDRQLHETLGLCVFALLVVRLVWRMLGTRPEPEPVALWIGYCLQGGARLPVPVADRGAADCDHGRLA